MLFYGQKQWHSNYTVLQQSHLILLSVNVYNNILICFSLLRHDLINSVIVYEIHYLFVKWCDWFFLICCSMHRCEQVGRKCGYWIHWIYGTTKIMI